MEWQPQKEGIEQIVTVLQNAGSHLQEVQQQVLKVISICLTF
jgi:hypothetical protein